LWLDESAHACTRSELRGASCEDWKSALSRFSRTHIHAWKYVLRMAFKFGIRNFRLEVAFQLYSFHWWYPTTEEEKGFAAPVDWTPQVQCSFPSWDNSYTLMGTTLWSQTLFLYIKVLINPATLAYLILHNQWSWPSFLTFVWFQAIFTSKKTNQLYLMAGPHPTFFLIPTFLTLYM
jgi:hypothetical protein